MIHLLLGALGTKGIRSINLDDGASIVPKVQRRVGMRQKYPLSASMDFISRMLLNAREKGYILSLLFNWCLGKEIALSYYSPVA